MQIYATSLRHAAHGSVERRADDMGSSIMRWHSAMRRHSADTRRRCEPRCRSAGWEWLTVRRSSARGQNVLRLGCFCWLIKYGQPACH